eukprot:TRINITY_DN11401_c0_g1_i1.p2 TRINITY_DN11401_c0_g1~~TRINITY_DN11401_c0_g1_i1.p2  ORF type:complete len:478 (-),score=90.02 TRINITY_DN11401_c0_g1_i1:349-1782(-)
MRSHENEERIFRNCGLDVLSVVPVFSAGKGQQPPPPAPSRAVLPESPIGKHSARFLALHSSVTNRNVHVARVDLVAVPKKRGIGRSATVNNGSPRKKAAEDGTAAADDEPDRAAAVDSKVLAAEIDNVAAMLRALMSDNPQSLGDFSQKAVKKESAEEEEGNAEDDLRARLRLYKMVRKIEEPVPPLQRLVPVDKRHKPPQDKVERNRNPTALAWIKEQQQRARGTNEAHADRVERARKRRAEEEHALEEKSVTMFSAWEQRSCNSAHDADLASKMTERVAVRETRMQEAAHRREASEAARTAKILEQAASREARSRSPSASKKAGTCSSQPSPRGRETSQERHTGNASPREREPSRTPRGKMQEEKEKHKAPGQPPKEQREKAQQQAPAPVPASRKGSDADGRGANENEEQGSSRKTSKEAEGDLFDDLNIFEDDGDGAGSKVGEPRSERSSRSRGGSVVSRACSTPDGSKKSEGR